MPRVMAAEGMEEVLAGVEGYREKERGKVRAQRGDLRKKLLGVEV